MPDLDADIKRQDSATDIQPDGPHSHHSLSAILRGIAVWILRIVVGGTFIVSGTAKLLDPWGFVYKIEQYLSAWSVDMPWSVVLVGAIALSGFELVMGTSLLLGCFRRGAAVLSTMFMVVMTLLTAYIWAANPVSDCGCFGDFIILSNGATFLKNLILLAALVYLWVYNKRVKGIFHPSCQWVVAVMVGLYALIVSVTSYNVQPLIDFRPYPVGSTFIALSESEDGHDTDDILFVYEKDGVRTSFPADQLPDSTWTFVERQTLSSRTATHERGITLYDGDEDVTEEVLTGEGQQLFMLIPNLGKANIAYTYFINELNRAMTSVGGEMIGIIATDTEGINEWRDLSMAEYPIYSADDTSIKEVARGNIAMVYVVDGMIKWKKTLSALPSDMLSDPTLVNPFETVEDDGEETFEALTTILICLLVALWLLQTFFSTTYKLLFQRRRKGKKELQPTTTSTPTLDNVGEKV